MRHAICLSLFLIAVVGCDDTASSAPDAAVLDASPPDAAPPDAAPPDAAQPDCTARGPERCNGVDDDCDGVTDEGFAVGTPCTVGRGACVSESVVQCTADGADAVCLALPGEPTAEVCNGIDDDCDDTIDEAIEATPCETGQAGVCAAGLFACVDGADVCAAVTAPGEEQYDDLDNDCDGATDEAVEPPPCYTGPPETRGQGICRDGLLDFVDGAPACVGEVVPPAGLVFEERRYPLPTGCLSMMLVDLNADGALDIVCGGLGVITMLVNDGGGDFAAPVALGGAPNLVTVRAAADIDLDGTVDLVASAAGSIWVIPDPLAEVPEPVLMPVVLEVPNSDPLPLILSDLAVADLNGDGAPDISFLADVLLRRRFLGWSANQGGGDFGPMRAIAEIPAPLRGGAGGWGVVLAHDVDGDGFIDLLAKSDPELYFARGGPAGPLDGVVPLAPEPVNGVAAINQPPPMYVADVTGDGVLDVVAATPVSGGEMAFWRASIGPGPSLGDGASFVFQTGYGYDLSLGQLDCDPEMEVLVEVDDQADTSVHAFPDANTLRDPVVLFSDPSFRSMAVGDIDGDGIDDIVIGGHLIDNLGEVRVHRRVP